MNDTLLFLVNGWAGKNTLLDGVGIFVAVSLIYIVFFVAALLVAYHAYQRQWKPVVYFCASLGVTFVVLQLAALLNVDQRPFMDHTLTQLVPHEPGQSFPSDHTTSSVAVALGVFIFTRFKKAGIALLVAACAIGVSRVFVGVHYPADIAGGIVTALIGAGLVAAAKKLLDKKYPTLLNNNAPQK